MNEIRFLEIMGKIDDDLISYAIFDKKLNHNASNVTKRNISALGSVAAVAVLLICPLPTLTALGVDPAYNILYHIAPAIAQTFKPVHKICEEQGIEMSVISAEKAENRIKCYIAMRDVDEKYADTLDIDLFDFNIPCDCTGYCSFSDYSTDEDVSYFVVNMERLDGKEIPDGKITFYIDRVLFGRQRFKDILTNVDLSNVSKNPAVTNHVDNAEYGYQVHKNVQMKPEHYLLPDQTAISTPIEGTVITGIGYIDGSLHIQTYYENYDYIHHNGFFGVWLADRNGDWLRLSDTDWLEVMFPNETHTGQYREMIFNIPYQDLSNYQVIGDIYKTDGSIDGKWEITIPLE